VAKKKETLVSQESSPEDEGRSISHQRKRERKNATSALRKRKDVKEREVAWALAVDFLSVCFV
jgi:hypothetical protein